MEFADRLREHIQARAVSPQPSPEAAAVPQAPGEAESPATPSAMPPESAAS